MRPGSAAEIDAARETIKPDGGAARPPARRHAAHLRPDPFRAGARADGAAPPAAPHPLVLQRPFRRSHRGRVRLRDPGRLPAGLQPDRKARRADLRKAGREPGLHRGARRTRERRTRSPPIRRSCREPKPGSSWMATGSSRSSRKGGSRPTTRRRSPPPRRRGSASPGSPIASPTNMWRRGALVPIMTRYPPPPAGAYVVRPPGQHPLRKVRVLTELLIECLAAGPGPRGHRTLASGRGRTDRAVPLRATQLERIAGLVTLGARPLGPRPRQDPWTVPRKGWCA